MGNPQIYNSYRFTIAAGKQETIPIYGDYLAVLDNSLTTNPEVSINGESFYEIPVGISVRPNGPFKKVEFKNPAASAMALWVAFGYGDILDSRTIITTSVSGNQLPVTEVTDGIGAAVNSGPSGNYQVYPKNVLIDNAAAVDVGGGVVGIPVTGHYFANGSSVTIIGTTNYNGTYVVQTGGTANQVNILATYNAETFDGTDDRIGLSSLDQSYNRITADAGNTRREVHIYNQDDTYPVYWGSSLLERPGVAGFYSGIPIAPETVYIIPCKGTIFLVADDARGVTGSIVNVNFLNSG